MDFVAKKRSEKIKKAILFGFLLFGFISGLISKNFIFGLKIQSIGFLIVLTLCLPEWGFWNRNSLNFVKVKK